jgi:hypothetical protein
MIKPNIVVLGEPKKKIKVQGFKKFSRNISEHELEINLIEFFNDALQNK